MSLNTFKRIIQSACMFLMCIGCSRQQGDKSVVTIQFPQAIQQQKGVSAMVTTGTSGTWGYSSPTTLQQITCYGVAISGVDNKNSKKCYRESDSTTAFEAQDIAAAIAAGDEISLEVASGKGRHITIFGFAAAATADCKTFSDAVPFSKLSRPYILGSKTIDLEPGTMTVPVSMQFDSAAHFDFCTDSFVPPQSPTPTTPVFADLEISTIEHTFPSTNVGAVVQETFTVTNVGSGAATNIQSTPVAPFIYIGGSYPGLGGTCPLTLLPSHSCTLAVGYAPTAVGFFKEPLTLNYVMGGGQSGSATVNLEGTVDEATFTFPQSSTTFPPTQYGYTSATINVVVHNHGNVPAKNISFSGTGASFTASHTCGVKLEPKMTCIVNLQFTPANTGMHNAMLTVSFIKDNGSTVANSTLMLSGQGTP